MTAGGLLPAAVARGARERGEGRAEEGSGQPPLLQGIQHRILAFLFRRAWPHGPASEPMIKFHGMFDYINSLVIWKVSLSLHPACANWQLQ